MPPARKRIVVIAGLFLLVVAVAAVAVKVQIDRIEKNSMALADTGQGALRMFGELSSAIKAIDVPRVLSKYDSEFLATGKAFWQELLDSERDGVTIYRWKPRGGDKSFGRADVEYEWSSYLEPIASVDHAKLNLGAVEEILGPDEAIVRTVLWLRGTLDSGKVFEARGHFRLGLRRHADGWKIYRQELDHGQTVVGDQIGFTDIAEASGLDFLAVRNPAFDTPEWRPERYNIVRYAHPGASTGDYDGDGWYDLFLANGGPARLFHNDGDGTFSDATATAGLPTDLTGVAVALFADFDNDGDRDLFTGGITDDNRLYRNEGDGTFVEVTGDAGLGGELVTVAAASDYDNDGDLDLYVGRYLDPRTELPITLFYTRNSAGNSLLRNDGDLHFTDVTEEAGVREGGLALGVGWADYDRDGDQDLYVSNDFGRNALLRNDGDGTFSDVSSESDAWDLGYGMSVTFGDIDNDTDLDLYVSNVHSGQRWYGQAATLFNYLVTSVKQGTIVEDFPLYRELFALLGTDWRSAGDKVTSGSSLLLNDGQGGFINVAEAAGANPFGWYWGSTMLDFDNDGLLDIYAANGWISGETYDDL